MTPWDPDEREWLPPAPQGWGGRVLAMAVTLWALGTVIYVLVRP